MAKHIRKSLDLYIEVLNDYFYYALRFYKKGNVKIVSMADFEDPVTYTTKSKYTHSKMRQTVKTLNNRKLLAVKRIKEKCRYDKVYFTEKGERAYLPF